MTRARGVALITALLVLAIAALAATALLSSASIAIHRTAALRDSEAGWWVARGVETWVQGLLDNDEKKYDSLGEDWAQPVDYLPVDQGFVHGHVVDLQGCFNLNNLSPAKDNPKLGLYQDQFKRLLQALPDLQNVPLGMSDALADWIDADAEPSSMNGAEDGEYLGLTPPYRAANQPFTVVSELLAVRGITPEIYAALTGKADGPCLAALPASATPSKVNVNTAPEAVLRALSSQTDEAKLRAFLERRKDEPLQDDKDIAATGIWGADATGMTTVRSNYFQIQGEVFVGSSRVALYSSIYRPEAGNSLVLAHSAEAE